MKQLVLLALLLLCFNCKKDIPDVVTPEPPQLIDVEAELKSLEETRQKFITAVKNKDGESIGKLVTQDVITISPGSSDWKDMYINANSEGPFPYDSIVMNPKETIIVSDSIAYDFGVSTVYYTNSEGNVVELKDSFLAILKKENDGIWRLHREVASSNVKN